MGFFKKITRGIKRAGRTAVKAVKAGVNNNVVAVVGRSLKGDKPLVSGSHSVMDTFKEGLLGKTVIAGAVAGKQLSGKKPDLLSQFKTDFNSLVPPGTAKASGDFFGKAQKKGKKFLSGLVPDKALSVDTGIDINEGTQKFIGWILAGIGVIAAFLALIFGRKR